MEALKDFIKLFEARQRSVKKKFNLIFISIQFSEIHRTLRVKTSEILTSIIKISSGTFVWYEQNKIDMSDRYIGQKYFIWVYTLSSS